MRGAGRLDLGGVGELMGRTVKRTTTVMVGLGALKAPWQAWCEQQGVTPSHPLRIALRQAMDRGATQVGQPELEGLDRLSQLLLP